MSNPTTTTTTTTVSSLHCFAQETAYNSILTLIAFVTVCINSGVIYTMATNPHLRTKRNAFLASLTVSDLLNGLVAIPLHILCNCLYTSVENLTVAQAICFRFIATSTMLNVFMITVERYIGIIYPIKYAIILTKPRTFILLSSTWATSLSSGLVSYSWLVNSSSTKLSAEEERLEHGYFIFAFVAFFFLPLVVMSVLYTKMFRAISKARRSASKARVYLTKVLLENPPRGPRENVERRKRSRSHGSYGDQLNVPDATTRRQRSISLLSAPDILRRPSNASQDSVSLGSQSIIQHESLCDKKPTKERNSLMRKLSGACSSAASKLHLHRQGTSEDRWGYSRVVREHRVLIIFVTMLSVFVFCWLTWYIMLLDFVRVIHVPEAILDCLDVLRFSVSFINPMLYTFLKKDFRIAFAKSVRGRRDCKKKEAGKTRKTLQCWV